MTDIFKRNPIRIPVKLVDGQWEFFYGGQLPVLDGTIGDLVVDKNQIEDKKFLKSLTRKSDHRILDMGTKLLVALTIKSHALPAEKYYEWLHYENEPGFNVEISACQGGLSPDSRFLAVHVDRYAEYQRPIDPDVDGGVWLHLKGLEPKGVISSSIRRKGLDLITW